MNQTKSTLIVFLLILVVLPTALFGETKNDLASMFAGIDTMPEYIRVGEIALKHPNFLREIFLDKDLGNIVRFQALFFLSRLVYGGKFPVLSFQELCVSRLAEMEAEAKTRFLEREEKHLVGFLKYWGYVPHLNIGIPLTDNLSNAKTMVQTLLSHSQISKESNQEFLAILEKFQLVASSSSPSNFSGALIGALPHIEREKSWTKEVLQGIISNLASQLKNLPTKSGFPKDYFDLYIDRSLK